MLFVDSHDTASWGATETNELCFNQKEPGNVYNLYVLDFYEVRAILAVRKKIRNSVSIFSLFLRSNGHCRKIQTDFAQQCP